MGGAPRTHHTAANPTPPRRSSGSTKVAKFKDKSQRAIFFCNKYCEGGVGWVAWFFPFLSFWGVENLAASRFFPLGNYCFGSQKSKEEIMDANGGAEKYDI